jgi:hypothetical protein
MSDGAIRLKVVSASLIATPPAGRVWVFFDEDNSDHLSLKDETGTVIDLQSALNYTDEKARDAVGSILQDTADIDFTYDDPGDAITAVLTTTAVVPGAYGSATQAPQITIDSKGRVTAAANVPISVPLDINGLTNSLITPATSTVPIYDPVLAQNRKVDRRFLRSVDVDIYEQKFSDFIVDINGQLTVATSGSGASNQASTFGEDNIEKCMGVSALDTGTTLSGRAALIANSTTGNPLWMSSENSFRFAARLAMEELSTGAEEFIFTAGFSDTLGASGTIPTNGVVFHYRYDVNGGRYYMIGYAGGVATSLVDTGILADTNYHIFEILFTDSIALGYIDNVLVSTINTGLPFGPTQKMSFGWKIQKQVGTATRILDADWYAFELYRSTGR